MAAAEINVQQAVVLRNEIMLQINQRLFECGVISREIYEQAKVKIISHT